MGGLGAAVATVFSALMFTGLNALPIGDQSYKEAPTFLDIARTMVLLCVITAAPCGIYGFFAGVAGGAWLLYRRSRLISVNRLVVEAAILGIFLGCAFPFVDRLVTGGSFVAPLDVILAPIAGAVCAATCAVVFRKNLTAQH